MNSLTAILSPGFCKNYFITMRPYLLFVSGITGLAGLSFAPVLSSFETGILFLVFFLSYGFGQALTDCFQIDTDSLSSPYRPLVKGILKRNEVYTVSIISLIICGTVLTYFSLLNLLFAFFSIMGLSTYTYFKRRWWGGPFYNGWIVALLFIIGCNSGMHNTMIVFTPQFNLSLVSVLFGYANFVLVGYYKDVEADAKTGYNTFLVVFGRKISSYASDFFALVFVITGSLSFFLIIENNDFQISHIISISFLLAAVIVSLYTQIQGHSVENDESAYKAVSPSVHTYILMFASIASVNKPAWSIPLFIFYIGFVATIKFRPEKGQI